MPALAHRLTLRPELWVQRVGGDDVVARRASRRCRRRPRRTSPRARSARDAVAPARPARRLRRPGGARRCSAALVLGPARSSWPRSPRRSRCCSRLGAAARGARRSSTSRVELDRERAVEGERGRGVALDVRAARRRAARARARAALRASRACRRRIRSLPLGRGEERSRSSCVPWRWGGYAVGDARPARARPPRARAARGARRPAATASAPTRARSTLLGALIAPLETQPFTGNQRRAREGRRRSSSPTCARSCTATRCGASTGAPARAATSCS